MKAIFFLFFFIISLNSQNFYAPNFQRTSQAIYFPMNKPSINNNNPLISQSFSQTSNLRLNNQQFLSNNGILNNYPSSNTINTPQNPSVYQNLQIFQDFDNKNQQG